MKNHWKLQAVFSHLFFYPLTLGPLLLGLAACGNAQMNWALLNATQLDSASTSPSASPTPELARSTQRKVQVGFGQGVASASGVKANIWMKSGNMVHSGTGVILKNVTVKR